MIPSGFTKVIVSLGALFILGGVCGFAVSNRQHSNLAVRAKLEERWISARIQEDTSRLQLTARQVEQVRPLYGQMLAEIHSVRDEAARGIVEAAKNHGRAMWTQLTPEQQQAFLRLNQERLVRWQKKTGVTP